MTDTSPVATAIASIMQITDPEDLLRVRNFIDTRAAQMRQSIVKVENSPTSSVTGFAPGDRVVLSGLQPAYVNGTHATVISNVRSRGKHVWKVVVEFEKPSGRIISRFGRTTKVPPRCLTKVAS